MRKILKTGLALSLIASILTAATGTLKKEDPYKEVLKEVNNARNLGLFPINKEEKQKIFQIIKLPKQYQKYVIFYGKKKAPVEGLVEYLFTVKGSSIILYKDIKNRYYFAGYLFDAKTGKNLTKEEAKTIAEINKKIAKIQYKNFLKTIKKNTPDFVIKIKGKGAKDKSIVLYTDPQCPFCKRFEEKLQGLDFLYNNYGTIYVVEYPLSFHNEAAQRSFWILNNVKKAKNDKEKLQIIKEGSFKKYSEIVKENKKSKTDYSKELQKLRNMPIPLQFGTPTITDTEGNDLRQDIMKKILINKFHLNKNQIQ
jgi:glutaredoxin